MKIRNERGFTGVDISIAVIIIFIFVSLITTLFFRYSNASKALEHRTDATYIAIDEIEKMKNINFANIENVNKNTKSITVNDEQININDLNDGSGEEVEEGYFRKILIEDYNDIDSTKQEKLVKRITVIISYMFNGKKQTVELSTILAKEI